MWFRFFIFTSLFLLLLPLAAVGVSITMPKAHMTQVKTPDVERKEDVFIEADQMDYDTNTQIVTATGHVQILKGENILFADKVTYDKNTDIVTAEGNVSTVGAEGNASFSDKVVMQGDLSSGVIHYFRTHLSDGSLLASARAKRVDTNTLILHKGVYSPCPICAENALGGSAPQWQIRANTITVDNLQKEVRYKDAVMEVYGLPVLYTPYFYHGMPGADSSSGFLMPTFRTDKNLGATITTPYYWDIAPDMDLTLQPMFTANDGPVYAGQFRRLTPYGHYEFFGSYTNPGPPSAEDNVNNDIKNWRGHIKGDGRFDITEHWDVGFDGEASSDNTYLARYNYGRQDLPNSLAYSPDLLTSKAYAERIDDRDYSSVQVVHFQSLLPQISTSTIPNALPYIQNHFETQKGIIPGLPSSVLWGDISGFDIERQVGAENQRISANTGISIPFVLPSGQIFQIDGSLRGDQYFIQNDPAINNSTSERLIPEISATWRYPMIDQISNNSHILLEPIVKMVVSPNRNYNKNIPNEDSQDVEFSDLNVFDNNRFRGLDAIESGPRLYYGLRGGYYENTYNVTYLLGQDYHLGKIVSDLPANSGIQDSLSDIVGRVSASFYNTFDISYKFRFDKSDFKSPRSEVDTTLDLKPVKFTLSYFNLDYDYTNTTNNREEVDGLLQYYVSDQWSVLGGADRNLSQHQYIDARGGVLYEGDCTDVLTSVVKTFQSEQDARSGLSVTVQLGLKNLGNL